jgi:hypothetical protein
MENDGGGTGILSICFHDRHSGEWKIKIGFLLQYVASYTGLPGRPERRRFDS